MHVVHKSVNKPLTIWGVERRMFFLALVMGAATFNFFNSFLGGILMFVALFTLARRVTSIDSQMLRILLNSAKLRAHYDPGKREAGLERHI